MESFLSIIMGTLPTIKELKQFENKDAQGPILRACDFVAVYAGKVFLYFPVTPNQVTLIWIIVKMVGLLLLVPGEYALSIVGVLVFHLGSIIDGADGIVARARRHFSLNGIYVDYVGHYLTNSLVLVALAFGVYFKTGSVAAFIPAGIGVFCFLVSKASSINPIWYSNPAQRAKAEELIYTQNLALKKAKNKLVAILFDVIRLENPFNVFFWGIVFGYTFFVLWFYAAANFLEMGRKVFIQFYRIYRSEKNLSAKN